MAERLSAKQEAVLRWLVAYPGVELVYTPGYRAGWTATWMNAAARASLVHVGEALGLELNLAIPRSAGHEGGTPHVTSGTLDALIKRKLLRPTKAHDETTYYQISRQGIAALLSLQVV